MALGAGPAVANVGNARLASAVAAIRHPGEPARRLFNIAAPCTAQPSRPPRTRTLAPRWARTASDRGWWCQTSPGLLGSRTRKRGSPALACTCPTTARSTRPWWIARVLTAKAGVERGARRLHHLPRRLCPARRRPRRPCGCVCPLSCWHLQSTHCALLSARRRTCTREGAA